VPVTKSDAGEARKTAIPAKSPMAPSALQASAPAGRRAGLNYKFDWAGPVVAKY
jgi:hypothetical protein